MSRRKRAETPSPAQRINSRGEILRRWHQKLRAESSKQVDDIVPGPNGSRFGNPEPLIGDEEDESFEGETFRSARIVCSPWEGIYLEQGQPWESLNGAQMPTADEIDRFIAKVLNAK